MSQLVGAVVTSFVFPDQQVRARDREATPYETPSTRVVRLVLQALEHVRVVRDQFEVDRCDAVFDAISRSVASPEAETPS